jgi:hypothetical protein
VRGGGVELLEDAGDLLQGTGLEFNVVAAGGLERGGVVRRLWLYIDLDTTAFVACSHGRL